MHSNIQLLVVYHTLQIHDGAFSDEDNIVGSYCGRDIPLPVISSINVLCVRFTTDGLFALTGFTASYKQVKGMTMPSRHMPSKTLD